MLAWVCCQEVLWWTKINILLEHELIFVYYAEAQIKMSFFVVVVDEVRRLSLRHFTNIFFID